MEETQHENPNIPASSSSASKKGNCFFTCDICFGKLPLDRKFNGCRQHPYCTNCVAKYIEGQVIYRNISKITCPKLNCKVMLDTSSYQSILPQSVFEKWCRALCESVVLLDASKGGVAYGRSYCPNRNCSELVLNECVGNYSSSKITESSCPSCKKLFCFQCMVPWKEKHQSSNSGEIVIDVDSKDDSLFVDIAKQKRWRRCPSCYHYVERNACCNKIRCRCETVFCHDCGSISNPCICGKEQQRLEGIRRERKRQRKRICERVVISFEMLFLLALVIYIILVATGVISPI